jgi:uncharacterized membrane protein
MLAAALALASALSYGLSDFVGGILSKSRTVWTVATASQLTAALGVAVVAVLAPGDPSAADFGWGAAAGLGGALGIVFLYRGLSRGRMSVVAPISGTGAALIPVVVGIAGGEQPSALVWVGIVLAFPAIYLIPQAGGSPADPAGGPPRPSAAGDGVVAGLGFGVLFALVGQIGEGAGFLPLAAPSAWRRSCCASSGCRAGRASCRSTPSACSGRRPRSSSCSPPARGC